MKAYQWLFLPLMLLSACIPYPRFTHVYSRPEYRVLFIDQSHNPIPNRAIKIHWSDKETTVMTDEKGIAYLPPKRRFLTFEFVTMDPPRYLPSLTAIAVSSKSPLLLDSASSKTYSFYRNYNKLITFSDTVLLRW